MMVKDLDIDVDLKRADWKNNFNRQDVENIFRELNFSSLIQRIPGLKPTPTLNLESKPEKTTKPTGKEITKKTRTLNILSARPSTNNISALVQIAAWLLNSEMKEPTLDEVYFAQFGKVVPGQNQSGHISKLYKVLWEKLKDADLIKVFEEIEVPLIPVLAEMEQNGIKIDQKAIKKLDVFAKKEIEKLEDKIYKLAKIKFNINSTQQLSEVLFNRLKLSGKVRKTPKGKLSTRAGELEKLREAHPIIPLTLEYRELQKLKTTYIEPFPKLVGKDGRIHTTFIQTGTVTGRLASQNPNLQNIPIKTELGQEFRKVFIA
ncbi:MAG: DNA polymerase I, partial [Parcubacteria group bacterium Gr01-1014_2]